MRRILFLMAAFLFAAVPASAATFADWGAVVVAGDWHAHDGSPSEIFDNARHDVTAGLIHMGFSRANILQFSVRPQNYLEHPLKSDTQTIANSLWDLSNRTNAGCLIYFSSHGAPSGVVLGDTILEPDKFSQLLDNACGDRPTVVIISACFSGVFVPVLAGPNRMIVTAARPDRTSFGCGSDVREPYFDGCITHQIPLAHDLPGLAVLTRACVAAEEKKTGMSPPSEPQISIGANIAQALPQW